jgi:hypothetical protein
MAPYQTKSPYEQALRHNRRRDIFLADSGTNSGIPSMKFYVTVFVAMIALLAIGTWTDAYSELEHVDTQTPKVEFQHASAVSINPGDFVLAD